MGLCHEEEHCSVLSLRQQCINFIIRNNIRFDFSPPPIPPEPVKWRKTRPSYHLSSESWIYGGEEYGSTSSPGCGGSSECDGKCWPGEEMARGRPRGLSDGVSLDEKGKEKEIERIEGTADEENGKQDEAGEKELQKEIVPKDEAENAHEEKEQEKEKATEEREDGEEESRPDQPKPTEGSGHDAVRSLSARLQGRPWTSVRPSRPNRRIQHDMMPVSLSVPTSSSTKLIENEALLLTSSLPVEAFHTLPIVYRSHAATLRSTSARPVTGFPSRRISNTMRAHPQRYPQHLQHHANEKEAPAADGPMQLPRYLLRELLDAHATSAQHPKPPEGPIRAFKVVLLGAESVGKTSLCASWRTPCTFQKDVSPTVAVEFWHQRIFVNNTHVSMRIWDTAGQQRFDSLAPMYYKQAHAAIILYDSMVPFSWLKAMYWVSEIREKAPDVALFLVATKVELPLMKKVAPCVPHEVAQKYAKESGAKKWIPVSAKKNYNVNYLFVSIARVLMGEKPKEKPKRPPTRQSKASTIRRRRKAKYTQEIGGCKPWQLDSEISHCNSCKKPFTLVLRRHHCRRCGRLFCHPCTKRKINIPTHPTYRNKLVRVCFSCYRALQQCSTL